MCKNVFCTLDFLCDALDFLCDAVGKNVCDFEFVYHNKDYKFDVLDIRLWCTSIMVIDFVFLNHNNLYDAIDLRLRWCLLTKSLSTFYNAIQG